MSDRARRLLAALAVPRELSRGETGVTAAGPPSTWKSVEIRDRACFGARSTLKDALRDLTEKLEEHGLTANQYLRTADQGRYSLDHVLVDVVELLRPLEEASHRQTLLGEMTPGDMALTPADRALFNPAALNAIDALSAEPVDPPRAPPEHRVDEARDSAATTGDREASPAGGAPGWRIWIAAGAAVMLVVAIVLLAVLPSGSRHRAASATVLEVAGGPTRTWSDPQNAGGEPGHSIGSGARIAVSCRLRGYEVSDHDVWWYRLAAEPWNGRFYATADAFYNDGRTSGSLKGSAFVDRRVPVCG